MTLARWALDGEGLVVGIGQNAHGALILAAGGGCDAVAIVDGLWGPWQTADDAIDEMYDGIRRMLDDDGATVPPPPTGLDPRTRHGYGVTCRPPSRRSSGARSPARCSRRDPASITPPDERAERCRWFGGDDRPAWSSSTTRPSRGRSRHRSSRRGPSVGSLPCWAGRRWTSSRGSSSSDGARTRTGWFREHEPVFHDEANDLWGDRHLRRRPHGRARPARRSRARSGSRPEAGRCRG